MSRAVLPRLAFVGLLTLLVAGCAYDYLQHTDRVGFSSGDAVKANLAGEASNPYTPGAKSTDGLGKNGSVIDPGTTDGSSGSGN